MDISDILKKIVEYAPVAGSFFGLPGVAAGTAIKAIGAAFGLGDGSTPEQVLKAVQGDPEANLKMFNAQSLYNLEMRKQDNEELKTLLADVQSARSREVEITKTTGKRDLNMIVVGWVIILSFVGMLGFLLYHSAHNQPIKDDTGILFMLMGNLVTFVGMVIGYLYGTSKGSMEKTALMGQMRQQIK